MGIIAKELRAKKKKEFWEFVDLAIVEADNLLEERGKEYNRGGVQVTDYAEALSDETIPFWVVIWFKVLRMKSRINSDAPREELLKDIPDVINYLRFEYAKIKMEE